MSGAPFAVLAVCTGNIGRSPMMERLLRHHAVTAGLADQVNVTSAGTWATVGETMEPGAAQALRERGVDSSGFIARQLQEPLVVDADLVLTATREHRAAVVQLVPAAVRRAFTLLELARVVGDLPPIPQVADDDRLARMRQVVAWAAQNRTQPADPASDDLADPFGAPLDVYRERAAQIDTAMRAVVATLRSSATH